MTREQLIIQRWLEAHFDAGSIRRVEQVTRNSMRITTRSWDRLLVICRQDGMVSLMDDVEAC